METRSLRNFLDRIWGACVQIFTSVFLQWRVLNNSVYPFLQYEQNVLVMTSLPRWVTLGWLPGGWGVSWVPPGSWRGCRKSAAEPWTQVRGWLGGRGSRAAVSGLWPPRRGGTPSPSVLQRNPGTDVSLVWAQAEGSALNYEIIPLSVDCKTVQCSSVCQLH